MIYSVVVRGAAPAHAERRAPRYVPAQWLGPCALWLRGAYTITLVVVMSRVVALAYGRSHQALGTGKLGTMRRVRAIPLEFGQPCL